MSTHSDRKLRISHRVVVGTITALVITFTIAAGLVSREQVAAQANPPQAPPRRAGVPPDVAERTMKR
jgi:hypothetical protein